MEPARQYLFIRVCVNVLAVAGIPGALHRTLPLCLQSRGEETATYVLLPFVSGAIKLDWDKPAPALSQQDLNGRKRAGLGLIMPSL